MNLLEKTYDEWCEKNKHGFLSIFKLTKVSIVNKFMIDSFDMMESFGFAVDPDGLRMFALEVSNFCSAFPERTYNAAIDQYGYGKPYIENGIIKFPLEYFDAGMALHEADYYSHLVSRKVFGRKVDYYKEKQDKAKNVLRDLRLQYFGDELFTFIKRCEYCGKQAGVDRSYFYKQDKKAICKPCTAKREKIKDLVKQKNEQKYLLPLPLHHPCQ